MSDYFVFGDIDSRDYSITIFPDKCTGIFDGAERDYSTEEIPGKDGELTIDGGRWKNTTVKYQCGISDAYRDKIAAFRALLTTKIGPQKLLDTFNPEYFRIATFKKYLKNNTYRDGNASVFDLEFSCKPQIYLASGETAAVYTATGTIINPTLFNAKPLLRVYGTGILGVGNGTITITAASTYTDIDCEAEECYKDTYAVNCNGNVELSSGDFPVLVPGSNGISLGTGITKVIITPRWETR